MVTDFSNKEDDDNEQETSEMKSEEFAFKTNVLAFASGSNARTKPRKRTSACSSARTVPTGERSSTDVEPATYSHVAYPSLQDIVLIPNNFFEYMYHIGCAINSHSITNSGLIPRGQILSEEIQTVVFLPVIPMNKDHKDPQELDLTKPRLA